MSKVIWGLLADIHAHEHSEFSKSVLWPPLGIYINSRLRDILDTLSRCFALGASKGVTHWAILGDVFHTRGQVPTVVRNCMWHLLERVHKEYGCEFVILVGNHDQADRNGEIHSIFEWATHPFVTIVDSPETIHDVHFIPYIADHDKLKEAIHAAPSCDALCLHAGIDGAAVGTLEYRIKDPITVDDLEADRFQCVFLGHYHKPQTLADNVVYVGSPCQITRAEAGDRKRFLVFTPSTGAIKSIRTKCPEFKTVTWPECQQDDIVPGYYDVVVEPGTDPGDVRQFFTEHSVQAVKIVCPVEAESQGTRLDVDETTDDRELIKQYVRHATGTAATKETRAALRDMGRQLLAESSKAVASNLRIRFLSVEVENFLSIGKAALSLAQSGRVIAVMGENHDALGFKSNGSGKSSLLPESLFWGLFGATARNVPADLVVNNISKRNCKVTVNLKVDKQLVRVVRTRKHKDLGTGLFVWVDNTEVTQGTATATQIYLEHLLGMDYTTFSAVVAFSPDTLRFVTSTDRDQKAVLDSILQTQRFELACNYTRELEKATKVEYRQKLDEDASLQSDLNKVEGQLSLLATQIELEKERKNDYDKDRQIRLNHLTERKEQLEKSISQLTDRIEAQEEGLIEVPDLMKLSSKLSDLRQQVTVLETKIQGQQRLLDQTQKELDAVVDMEGKPCPKCGQVINNLSKLKASLSTTRRVQTAELEELKKPLPDLVQLKKAAELEVQDATRLQTTRREQDTSLSQMKVGVRAKKGELAAVLEDLAVMEQVIYDDRVLSSALAKKQSLQAEKTKLRRDLELIRASQEEYSQLLGVYAFWVTGFSNKGIKSFLLDSVVPHLTKYAQKYADKLTGNSLSIQFSTLSHTGSDKFSISAINNEGADVYAGNSSGEKRRVDLAVMFALFALANSRVKLNLMLLDECFDTLDSAGIDSVVEILEELAAERKLTIFVTSHTELSGRLHESITVVKRGGISKLKH